MKVSNILVLSYCSIVCAQDGLVSILGGERFITEQVSTLAPHFTTWFQQDGPAYFSSLNANQKGAGDEVSSELNQVFELAATFSGNGDQFLHAVSSLAQAEGWAGENPTGAQSNVAASASATATSGTGSAAIAGTVSVSGSAAAATANSASNTKQTNNNNGLPSSTKSESTSVPSTSLAIANGANGHAVVKTGLLAGGLACVILISS